MTESDDDEPLARASAAPTPRRQLLSDFFRKVPKLEHIQGYDTLMATDDMDLRNVFRRSGAPFGELMCAPATMRRYDAL
jgi:hypothetical protein